MVSEAMAAYLRKLREKNGKLVLCIDIENTFKDSRNKPNAGIAVRWDAHNLYDYSNEELREIVGRLFLLMCYASPNKNGWVEAVDIITKYDAAARQWVEADKAAKAAEEPDKEIVRELNRIAQNKPREAE